MNWDTARRFEFMVRGKEQDESTWVLRRKLELKRQEVERFILMTSPAQCLGGMHGEALPPSK